LDPAPRGATTATRRGSAPSGVDCLPRRCNLATKATTGRTRKKTAEAEATAPEPDEIAKRAYEIYESGAEGDELGHWLQAERELAGAAA
jgi:hypothetical protein